MMADAIIQRLMVEAYNLGWRDANHDHIQQVRDPQHPIGASLRTNVAALLGELDPHNLLGLRR